MAYRRRTFKGKRRTTFKKKVLGVLNAQTETKHVSMYINAPVAAIGDKTFTDANMKVDNMLSNLTRGTGPYQIIGNEFICRGIRLEYILDNSSPIAEAPLYVSSAIVMTYANQEPAMLNFFKGYGVNPSAFDTTFLLWLLNVVEITIVEVW